MAESINENTLVEELEKTRLLNLLKQICSDMDSSDAVGRSVRTLFRQSYDPGATTHHLIKQRYGVDLSGKEAETLSVWIRAHLRKSPVRKTIPQSVKDQLVLAQNGKCAICGKPISSNSSETHVDHIIPWTLVGDELQNNYQALCDECNHKKSGSVDYLFRMKAQY